VYIYRRYLINALLLYIEFLCVLLIMISSKFKLSFADILSICQVANCTFQLIELHKFI